MPIITDKERALIGKETAPRPLTNPANEVMAKHWCEMVEDANPVYFDEAYARATWLQGAFAPPTMMTTWGMGVIWPQASQERSAPRLELEGCTTTIAVNC